MPSMRKLSIFLLLISGVNHFFSLFFNEILGRHFFIIHLTFFHGYYFLEWFLWSWFVLFFFLVMSMVRMWSTIDLSMLSQCLHCTHLLNTLFFGANFEGRISTIIVVTDIPGIVGVYAKIVLAKGGIIMMYCTYVIYVVHGESS